MFECDYNPSTKCRPIGFGVDDLNTRRPSLYHSLYLCTEGPFPPKVAYKCATYGQYAKVDSNESTYDQEASSKGGRQTDISLRMLLFV
jgi:hypothetical protein